LKISLGHLKTKTVEEGRDSDQIKSYYPVLFGISLFPDPKRGKYPTKEK
jgi:hypothetical protein